MLFRIENCGNISGKRRDCQLPKPPPIIPFSELQHWLAVEIRKAVNGANNRRLLSYSKSLGVCLLKYNRFADNALHLNRQDAQGYAVYSVLEKHPEVSCARFDLEHGLYDFEGNDLRKAWDKDVLLSQFQADISDNDLLDAYLRRMTGGGRKLYASPQKDHEVLRLQSPEDCAAQSQEHFMVHTYLYAVYLLYGLFWKYGMDEQLHYRLCRDIMQLDKFHFTYCGEEERSGLLHIIFYLYSEGNRERAMAARTFAACMAQPDFCTHYSPIWQLYDIQQNPFDYALALSDYNSNVVSDCIWARYQREFDLA